MWAQLLLLGPTTQQEASYISQAPIQLGQALQSRTLDMCI